IHRGFSSQARKNGFNAIWGMALRNAKKGNIWFKIKGRCLRENLKCNKRQAYSSRQAVYELIEALCDLGVIQPYPGNAALDYNLYRWAIPTNIWKIADGTYDDEIMPL